MSDGILIGLWALVWVHCLCQPDEIFDFVPTWAARLARHDGLGTKIYKAICGCAKCHAGQVAFWYSVVSGKGLGQTFETFVFAVFTAYFIEAWMERQQCR